MKIQHQLIASGLIASIGIMTALGIYHTQSQQAQAQAEPTDRFFSKDYCTVEKTLFDDITYTSPQDPLSYDITDCPNTQIIIHRWDELTVGEKALITARMSAQGYEDITAEILSGN